MDNILLLDTSIASLNKGDDIIMECVRKELKFLAKDRFTLNLPTHVSPFHCYQIWRNSNRLQVYRNCPLKFVGGTNLLVPNLLTHFPQWNINIFNYQAIKGCILLGVGAGAGDMPNAYSRYLYKKLLNHDYIHSARDQRSADIIESMGFKAMNTGCVTMWMLTPEFCRTIPTNKASRVVFTLTASTVKDERDQFLIDTLLKEYNEVFFWIQGYKDWEYLNKFSNIENIKIIPPTIEDYSNLLKQDDLDYVGTRLHAGVYAMRHAKRAIIIVIDERAREINKSNNLNCIEKDAIQSLPQYINTNFETKIKMPFDKIKLWKAQFS